MKKVYLTILLTLSISVYSNNINIQNTPFLSEVVEYGECVPDYAAISEFPFEIPSEGPHHRQVTTCTYIWGVHVWTSTSYEHCSP